MSDIPNPAAPFADPRGASLLVQDGRTKRRNAAEGRFKLYGIIAIVIGLLMLLTLLFTIISRGTGAFQQTYVTLSVPLLEDKLDKNGNRDLEDIKKVSTFGYSPLLKAAFENKVEAAGIETDLKSKDMADILSKDAAAQLRDHVLANPELIGTAAEFEFLTNSRVDGYLKGRVTRESIANDKNISAEQLDFVDVLIADGSLEKRFNLDFITGADASDARPEAAGMGVSMIGSFAMMLVVLVLALPIGVAASIYLEEFAPKNWITDIIEVNISNLAAVPSIVFGILGLAVFINYMHLPNSAPLVGGLVLTLMTLPTIIISTRASLKSVPPSIRDAALGVGASKMQSVFHHVLPLAAPGILTGTIIGLAQALGETAPLLLIGMVGFIASNPPESIAEGLMSPNSAMPAQIYEWAKRADPAFYERAWGGIIILLVFLISMNAIAVLLRRRFERRW
ncbi:phosphate ABC transporter permease [Sulfitobacter sp. HI0082]|jgi:phosphate transport system permease protein|uniref:Phosphate transport system permease protein PstA n=2 Tax=Rhodobacterales TaxID=204455 RepID=A0ABW1Z1D3_9RHOB|nr:MULTISPECIES: phosphate ABC transporter permease PstA [Sulfitobacter]KZZ30477.1 phosphate ABC transporter permease [Sulfitobacter sp. HI0082]KZX93189.1 phosphate ABC transporter permease [Sulfitobacter sp. HI0021]KZY03418.1 phosphate ABC transporter permease [Sulfitobacter sp. HI0027]KZZ01013.1 phosphate ABC transporter permease [Sulfitobacter sp. HI0076]UWR36065.1 phosphate ABC transporter permease PstA [Sulfitobacter sp. W074]|tara:strand:- start:963 stop:2318 length:1356 start_codon:yes stop_codon:yes gene_type:complete